VHHTCTCLLVHAIFSTKDRKPHITADLATRLFPYLGGIAREVNATAIRVNGPADHVHLLLSIPATVSLADLVRTLKANSSRWVHEEFPQYKNFAWQSGYAAFTVSNSQAAKVKRYIESQLEHHRKTDFRDEFALFLAKHDIEYNVEEFWQ
jgi:REP element-mobilizing transposase RayT